MLQTPRGSGSGPMSGATFLEGIRASANGRKQGTDESVYIGFCNERIKNFQVLWDSWVGGMISDSGGAISTRGCSNWSS